jgi:hypothetical protein
MRFRPANIRLINRRPFCFGCGWPCPRKNKNHPTDVQGLTGHSIPERTHTWGRTYWGGAMFCLVADVQIRKATGNRKGLQDAVQAIVAAQGTIDTEWPLSRVLETGDRTTGTTVLVDLYRKWKDAPIVVDLDQLWQQLGVRVGSRGIELDANAPLVSTRRAMTSPPKQR